MKFYQVAIKGCEPRGGLFDTEAEARREIRFLRADDQAHADEAMHQAGIDVKLTDYVIVEVTR